jgi:hypothetical protein
MAAQRGVQASRSVAGGQQHAHARAGADAVGDELGRGQPDVASVVEDEQGHRCHGRSLAKALRETTECDGADH